MINQYLKIMIKNFKKDFLNSIFAIISFSIGLIVFALISSYVLFHLEYDSSIKDTDQWYRLRVSETHKNAQTLHYAEFYGSKIKKIKNEIPEIMDFSVRADFHIRAKFTNEKGVFIPLLTTSCLVTPNYPAVLNLKFIHGDPDSALTNFSDMIISKSYALKYFGKVNAIGEKVLLNNNVIHKISGVFEDMPDNSHYKMDCFRFYQDMVNSDSEDSYLKSNVLIKINNHSNISSIEKKINKFLKEYDKTSQTIRIAHIDPIRKVHFIQNLLGDNPTKSVLFIYALSALALLLLISALLNFYNLMNLSWKKRLSEFTNRKILGASKKGIVLQLMTEYSFLFCCSIVTMILVYLGFKNVFYQWTEVNLSAYELFSNLKIFILMLIIIAFSWVLGFIPASQMANIKVYNENEKLNKRNRSFKLILFSQIFISVFFIFIALVIYSQISFMRNYDLKYDHKNLLQYSQFCANIPGYVSPKVLRQELEKIPEITSVTMTSTNLMDVLPKDTYMFTTFTSEVNGKEINRSALICPVDKSFFAKMKINKQKGSLEEISPYNDYAMTGDAVITESAARLFFPNTDPINKKMKMPSATIKAVIDDVYFEPLSHQIIPKLFFVAENVFEYVQIRYKEGTKDIVIKKANKVFDRLTHNNVFYYDYVDVEEKINEYYKDDILLFNLIVFFALICSVIAIMGIYSISSLHIFSQMKDIAIHKVNGAEMLDIFKRYFKFYAILGGSAWLSASAFSLYLLDIYMHKFKVQMKYTYLLLILSFVICFLMILIPLYLNVRKAYKSDASIYLNND